MRAAHVHRVTPADVGRRVSVRRWLDGEGGAVTDVLGILTSYEDGQLTVDGKAGLVSFAESAVLASRTVPPPPPPRPRRAV